MSNDSSSIHNFEFEMICDYFLTLERQGPGSPEATLQALQFIDNLNTDSQIADIGCGTGGQTITLAQHAPGTITAIDLFPSFIHKLNEQTARLGLEQRIHGKIGSMESLPFADHSLDLILSEGAIYNIGFNRGINEWNRFLKSGGYLAVSEVAWFTDERPAEIESFWNDAYPEIDTIAHKTQQMQQAGYIPVASFILPEKCWTEHFYVKQETAQITFLEKYKNNPRAHAFLANQKQEEKMYERYKEYYGYVFFIGKKFR